MSFGPGFPYLPAFSAPQLVLSTSLANKPSASSDSTTNAGGLLNGSENMSAETLRFLAANHNFPPHLLPGLGPRMDGVGAVSLPSLDQFRGLPPTGLPPLGLYPGIGGPGAPMDLKGDPMAALVHGQGGLPPYYYDACFGAAYPYGDRFGNALDLNGARRKNATRETTAALKAWLYEHRKNPYPTKGEKIMLAIITKMTLTQVSTWFANARRRLKKENKMTWSPRNRSGEDDDDDHTDDHNQTGVDSSERAASSQSSLLGDDIGRSDDEDDDEPVNKRTLNNSTSENHNSSTSETNNNCADKIIPVPATDSDCTNQKRSSDAEPSTPTKKPKIWSIADHVNSQSPSSMQRQQQNQHLQQQKCNEIMNGATTSTGVGPPQPLPSPYHLTFPPWPHHMAAMFPRPPMIPMPGSGAGGLAPPQFLANLPQMMVPRPELLFRSLVPNHSMAPGLLTFSQSSALAMSNFLQPSGSSVNSDIIKSPSANQTATNSVSPISSTSSAEASSPRNVTKQSASSSHQAGGGEKKL